MRVGAASDELADLAEHEDAVVVAVEAREEQRQLLQLGRVHLGPCDYWLGACGYWRGACGYWLGA